MRKQDLVSNPEMAPHTDTQGVSLETLQESHRSDHSASLSDRPDVRSSQKRQLAAHPSKGQVALGGFKRKHLRLSRSAFSPQLPPRHWCSSIANPTQ